MNRDYQDPLELLQFASAVRIQDFRNEFLNLLRDNFVDIEKALKERDQGFAIKIPRDHWFFWISETRLEQDLNSLLQHDLENELKFLMKINVLNGEICLIFRNVAQ